MGVREDRRRERRAAVLDAAMEMIEEGGAPTVTIAGVADRIGASVGGMYRYFPTKQAIFAALQLRAIDTFETHLKRQLEASSSAEPLERVVAAFSCWLSFRQVAPSYHRLLDESLSSSERTLDDAQAADVHARLEGIIGLCASTIEAAVDAGDLAPGDALIRTHLLWSALHGLGHFQKRDHLQPSHLRVEPLMTALFETHFSAWSSNESAS